MNIKILLLLLFVVVIIPIVFSSKSSKALNNATKSSESPKSGKLNPISKSTKKPKPSKPKPSKCTCKPKPKPKPKQNQRIFRGDEDENAPYQILIEIRFDKKSEYKKYGGVLVSKKHIVTVAHIFRPYRGEGKLNYPNTQVNGQVHAGVFDKTHVGQEASPIQSREINRRHITIFPSK